MHARGQVAHADLGALPALGQLRRLLPADLTCRSIGSAPPGFHARFSALWRRYSYRVDDGPPDPVRRGDTLAWPRPLDLDRLRQASADLLGLHDFAAFCRAKPHGTSIRTLLAFDWVREPAGALVATLVADAFCHQLVRSLVGALLAVGDGRRRPDWPAALLRRPGRAPEVFVVPAHALCLEEVGYPPAEELARRAQLTRARRSLPASPGAAEGGDSEPVRRGTDSGRASGTVVGVGPAPLRPADIVAVARHGARAELTASGRSAMDATRRHVEALAAGAEPVYGVSTGFGALASRAIPAEHRRQLQVALLRSHAAGMGPPVEREVVRAMVLLRARTLATGHTGARSLLADGLLELLNHDITPAVPEFGSLGCSGDLAPLAHVGLVLLGEGQVLDGAGGTSPAAAALAAAGLSPVMLEAKEGLALINGTDGMLGMLVLACQDAGDLLAMAEVAAAMSVEALLGTDRAFAAELIALRPHPGQATSAAHLRSLLAGSAIVASHRHGDLRVQDAYSLRCAPQVIGAARDALGFVAGVVAGELAAAIDNPVVLADGQVCSVGNFHGAPLALAADLLAIAAADVASIAERRVDRLLDAHRSAGLPAFLAADPGVDSGLMIAQYTAAACVAEARRLALPASTDSIPTSAMQEDHVSMGWAAARKLRRSLEALARVLAIEAVTAARGLDLRAPLAPAGATAAVREALRARVGGPGPDRELGPELAAAVDLVRSGALLAAAESVTGPLRTPLERR